MHMSQFHQKKLLILYYHVENFEVLLKTDIIVCTKINSKGSIKSSIVLYVKKTLCSLLSETVLLFLLHQVICFHQDLQGKHFESTTCIMTTWQGSISSILNQLTYKHITVLSCTLYLSIQYVLNSFPQVPSSVCYVDNCKAIKNAHSNTSILSDIALSLYNHKQILIS